LALLIAGICACGAASAQTPAQGSASPATELREVVVSASGFEQDIKEAPASITVIPREELAKGRFGSLTDALEAWAPSSASKSSAAPCPRSTARMPWAA
jgi:outer membrane receptor for ferrienterochelin and colicins